MKNLIDSRIHFSVITEDALMQAHTLDSSQTVQQVLMTQPGALYVLQEPQSSSLDDALLAERSGEDLLLAFRAQEQAHPALTFEQFFANNGRLHVLKQDGELLRAVMSDDNPQQGPVAFALQAASAPEQQMVDPVLELLQEVMFPAAQATPESSAAMAPAPQADPVSAPVQLASLNIAPLYAEPPQITHALDQVGARQGSLASGNVTDDRYATVEGTGTPGAYLEILDNGEIIGEVRVGSDGRWSFEPDQAYNEAGHILTAREQGSGESSTPFVLVVDTIAPSRAFIDSISDDRAGGQLIERNGHTSDNTPVIKGRAEPFSVVVLYSGKNPMGTAFTDASGNWEFSSLFIMPDGEYTISATALDFSGNAGLSSTSYKFTVDTLPPATPSIDQLTDDVGPVQGALQAGAVTDDSRPTLTGRSEAGTVVSIYDNAHKLGEVRTDENGNWSFTPLEALLEGEHSFTVRAQDAAGNQSELSQPWGMVIDTTAPEKPDSEGSSTGISAVIDDHGPIQGPIDNGGVTDDTTPTFNGTGEVGDTILIRDGEAEIGRVEVDSDGNWSFTPEQPLADGEHAINFIIQDQAGNQSEPSDPWVVIVDTRAPEAPTISAAYDDVGAVTGELVSGAITDDTRPTLTGQAEAGAEVSIYDNGSLLGSTHADASGNWSFTPENELVQGAHRFTAVARDTAGNLSTPSDAFFDLTIGIAGARIDDVLDDVGPIQGSIGNGQHTDDTTPTLSGQGKPGDTVHIYDNGDLLGSSQVGENGRWQFIPPLPLPEGGHSFTAITEDAEGNLSVPSAPYVVIIDLTAPTQVATITSMSKDSGFDSGDWLTNDGSAGRLMEGTLSAALAANEKLQVSTDGGLTWVDALVDGTDWSAQDNNSHDESWMIQLRVADSAGNIGDIANQGVELDTASPGVPLSVSVAGSQVSVTFNSQYVEAGYTINLAFGETRINHVLTQANINAGVATFTSPTSLSGYQVDTRIVDLAGNTAVRHSGVQQVEDFTDFQLRENYVSLATSTVTITTLTAGGIMRVLDDNQELKSRAIYLFEGNDYKFTLNTPAQTVSLRVGHNDYWQEVGLNGNYFAFYNAQGKLLHTHDLDINRILAERSDPQDVTYTAPDGWEIAYFRYFAKNELGGIYIDDIAVTAPDVGMTPVSNVVSTEGSYHGDTGDNVFESALASNVGLSAGVRGSGGTDTFKLTGTDQVLDMNEVGSKFSSIEIFDITGTGDNTLKLSLGDVLENGGKNLFLADDNVQLMVKGDAGDKVVLDDLLPNGTDPGEWAAVGAVTVEGLVYNTYQHSGLNAELLVQQGVTVDLV